LISFDKETMTKYLIFLLFKKHGEDGLDF